MTNLATDFQGTEVIQETGTLERVEGGVLTVRTGAGCYAAERAVSCLVQPREGDTVLVATAASGSCWVLAVLRQGEEGPTRLELDGDLELRLGKGRFTIAAQEGVGIVSGKDLDLVSGRFSLRAVDGTVAVQRLSLVGRFLQSEIERVKTLASSVDAVVGRLTQRLRLSIRSVEQVDQVKAGQVDYQAERVMSLRGGNTVMTAKQLVKVDGEQIHMG